MVSPSIFEMLQITNLTKQFKKIKAVDNISLKVQKGDIYGFLGPNGAGKTTSIRMIMGIIKPDNGTIKLNASDINTINRRKLGYLPEDRGLYQKQNLIEILYYFGCLKGLWKANILPVTSNQDFFGVSVMEAIYCEAYPILPNRLSFPELIPKEFHCDHFYQNDNELIEKLKNIIKTYKYRDLKALKEAAMKFDWNNLAPVYDAKLASLLK